MPIYLTEVHLATASEHELERAVRMLDAAMDRMPESLHPTRTVFAGHSREDGRLVCLIEAASIEAARRLVSLARYRPGVYARSPSFRDRHYSDATQEAILTAELIPNLLRML